MTEWVVLYIANYRLDKLIETAMRGKHPLERGDAAITNFYVLLHSSPKWSLNGSFKIRERETTTKGFRFVRPIIKFLQIKLKVSFVDNRSLYALGLLGWLKTTIYYSAGTHHTFTILRWLDRIVSLNWPYRTVYPEINLQKRWYDVNFWMTHIFF